MLVLKIEDTKSFMNKLLLQSTFDDFCLIEASVTTFQAVHIDGRLQKNFYSSEELENNALDHLTFNYWKMVKPFFLDLIKGKRTPLSFKLTLSLSPADIETFIMQSNITVSIDYIHSLLLNFRFDGEQLTCTTGCSLSIFTTDKSLEYEWDEYTKKYFKDHIISTLLN